MQNLGVSLGIAPLCELWLKALDLSKWRVILIPLPLLAPGLQEGSVDWPLRAGNSVYTILLTHDPRQKARGLQAPAVWGVCVFPLDSQEFPLA